MEKCVLTVRLPDRGAVLPHPYSLPETGGTVSLDICELNVKRPLKERELSWSTRPVCIRQLGTLEAKIGGQVEMEVFECKSGSFIGYQISCGERSPECNVDVWTNHNQTWGMVSLRVCGKTLTLFQQEFSLINTKRCNCTSPLGLEIFTVGLLYRPCQYATLMHVILNVRRFSAHFITSLALFPGLPNFGISAHY